MASVHVTATMLDGTTYEVEGIYMGLADRVALERKYGKSVPKLIEDKVLLEEHVAFLAYRMFVRAGVAVGEFDAFIDDVENIEMSVPEDEDPTEPTAPTTN